MVKTESRAIDIVVPAIGARQHGLLTTPQLAAAGLAPHDIDRLIRSGRIERARRGLFRLKGWPRDACQELMAACLHPTGLACLSHLTAARQWGMWQPDETSPLEVSVRYPRKLSVAGLIVHRSRDLELSDVTCVDGIPVTTPTRTLCDLGLVLPESEVHRLLDHAIAIGLVEEGRVRALRIRTGVQGRNGAGMVGRALDALPPRAADAESGPEVELLRLLTRAGLPAPVLQYPIWVAGVRYRVDLAYPDVRLAIEYDGEQWHHTPAQLRRDAERQAAIEGADWQVERVRHLDLEPARVAALVGRIRQFLRRG